MAFPSLGRGATCLRCVIPSRSGWHGPFRGWSAPATSAIRPPRLKPVHATGAGVQADPEGRVNAVSHANGERLAASREGARLAALSPDVGHQALLMTDQSTRKAGSVAFHRKKATTGGLQAPKKPYATNSCWARRPPRSFADGGCCQCCQRSLPVAMTKGIRRASALGTTALFGGRTAASHTKPNADLRRHTLTFKSVKSRAFFFA